MHPKFTIFTPAYHDKSAGVWMLHFLCDRLNRIGYPAEVVIMQSFNMINPKFLTPIAYDGDSIVIYPEVISENPLGAGKVVRYLLNHEGFFTGSKIEWNPTDFPLSFSKVYRNDCDILFYPIVDLDIFYRDGREKESSCLYTGKADYKGPIPQLDYKETITHTWPESKQELAEIFRNRLLLFSCDTNTATCLDAALCGCVPIILGGKYEEGDSYYGKCWANDHSEIMDALKVIDELPEKIRIRQNNFDAELSAIVTKIIKHFEMHS